MELIIWRHAEAEAGEPDEARALTAKGQKQAAKMGAWLDRHLPHNCKILVSPAVRTVQTAEALGRKFKIHPGLAQGSPAQEILAATQWPKAREPVLVVGHQPALGRLISLLIGGSEQDWIIRKGAVFWIAQKSSEEEPLPFIRVALGVDMLSK